MSLPIFQIKRRDKDTNLETSTNKQLNGLIEGELGYNYFDNGLWIGPKGSEDGSEFAILVNKDSKITNSRWVTDPTFGPVLQVFQSDSRDGTGSWISIASMPVAQEDLGGIINADNQTFGGVKTFADGIKVNTTPTVNSTTSIAVLNNGQLSSITPSNLIKSCTNLAGTGLTMNGATIKTKLDNENSLGTIGTNKIYAVGVDSNGKLAVNIPWEDTHYNADMYIGTTDAANNSATKNGATHLKLYENGSKRSQFKIYGSGLTEVESDSSGNIVIDTDLTAEDITEALGYVPEGFYLVTFSSINPNSNILTADFDLQQIQTAFANQSDVRGQIDIDDVTVYVTPCIVENNQIIFIGYLGLQMIAITMTNDSITLSKAELITPDHQHEITYVPLGSVSQPTFTGNASQHTHTFTGEDNTHDHTFTGQGANHRHSFTGVAHNHTFTGSEVTSEGASATTSINSVTSVGTSASHRYTPPSLTDSVENKQLKLAWDIGVHEFITNKVPTVEAVTVATEHTHKVTAAGNITDTTATGIVENTFITPQGTISETTITPVGNISETSITPTGTVSKPLFTGTSSTIKTSSAQ